MAPDFDRAVYPPELRGPLRALDYQLDVEVGEVTADPDGFLDRAEAALAARRAAFAHVLSGGWDLAVCVLTETDRVHHFLWSSLTDPAARLHGRILDFYRRVDEAVAELADRAGDGALFLASDHGFGPAHTQFYVNAWLRRAGYLALPPAPSPWRRSTSAPGRSRSTPAVSTSTPPTASPAADRPPTPASSPRGCSPCGSPRTAGSPRAAPAPRRLRGALRPKTYAGPYADAAPDLVVMPAPGVQIRGAWATDRIIGDAPLTGTHTRPDATFWCRGDQGTDPCTCATWRRPSWPPWASTRHRNRGHRRAGHAAAERGGHPMLTSGKELGLAPREKPGHFEIALDARITDPAAFG
ncbi:hypothetical protein GCM10017744_100940 [Streptomyces antimycoticus]